MKASDAPSVPPLTSSTLDRQLYVRRPDVTAAIALVLSQPREQWEDFAARPDAGRLPSEALVHLLRLVRSVDRDLFGRLAWQLILRIESVAKRWARGFDLTTTEELIESVQKKVADVALAIPPSRQSDFLEVSFAQAVKRYTIKAVEKRRNAPLPLTAHQHSALVGDDEDAQNPTEQVVDDSPNPEELVSMLQDIAGRGPLLRLAQDAVKDIRHYEAILLHHGFGWPIASTDPAKQSLTDFFGVSERQIRNWIKSGLAAIKKALE